MPTRWYTTTRGLFFAIAFLLCGQSFAVRAPNFRNPQVPRFNYGFIGLFGQGQMGNNTDAAPPRDMDFTTYQAFVGFRVNKYRYSIVGEYSYVAQMVEAETVSNSNLAGQSYTYGPKFEYYDGKQSFGLIYRVKSAYRLNKLDANDHRQYYGAKTGFNIQYTHRVKGRLGLVIDYAREEYDRSLADKVKWERVSIGFIFSNFDKSPFPLPDAN